MCLSKQSFVTRIEVVFLGLSSSCMQILLDSDRGQYILLCHIANLKQYRFIPGIFFNEKKRQLCRTSYECITLEIVMFKFGVSLILSKIRVFLFIGQ